MPRSVSPSAGTWAALRAQVDRAGLGPGARTELEHLMADVAAEILLLEVELRRNEGALLRAMGPRVKPPDTRLHAERRLELRAELSELRGLAAEIRARLTGAHAA